MDFTPHQYHLLLIALRDAGYTFVPMEAFAEQQGKKVVCLRHDVDKRPLMALPIARIERHLGIKATYYFRSLNDPKQSFVMRQIAALGHELGYHYEDMRLAQGDADKAFTHFREQLAYFRTFYPVSTICMHGAPTSPFDGKALWNTHNYHSLGITTEPYLDLDYSKVFYLTDTGRCWDGFLSSVRDKIPQFQDQWTACGLVFHTTQQLIQGLPKIQQTFAEQPHSILITTHPQRWTDNRLIWWTEYLMQPIKNEMKKKIIRNKYTIL